MNQRLTDAFQEAKLLVKQTGCVVRQKPYEPSGTTGTLAPVTFSSRGFVMSSDKRKKDKPKTFP
jgi:hypothetical protein